jgi:RNA polymerase sigma factor (sigma-70 family)
VTAYSAPPSKPPAGARNAERHDRIAGMLDAARRGDQASLDVIVAELTPLVWHTARAAGLDYHAAEDAVQTVWIRLLQHLATIEHPAALTSWLVVVTRHEAWRMARTARRDRPLDDRAAATWPDPGPTTERQAELSDQSRRLWHAVSRLSAECQILLRLAAFAPGVPLAVVSDAVSRPPGAVGPTRIRCMKKLRRLLDDDPAGGWR